MKRYYCLITILLLNIFLYANSLVKDFDKDVRSYQSFGMEYVFMDLSGARISQDDFRKRLKEGSFIYLVESFDEYNSIRFALYPDPGTFPLEDRDTFYRDYSLIGHAAPVFEAPDLEGEIWTLNELKGSVVVLNFWSAHCSACEDEIPSLNDLVKEYEGYENVVFLALSYDSKDELKEFLTEADFSYTIIPDQSGLSFEYNLVSLPSHIVIDKSGAVSWFYRGSDENLARILSQKIRFLL